MRVKNYVKQWVAIKRLESEALPHDLTKQGFKGWYASKNLPHFDFPGVSQFITFRLANSFPGSLRAEWSFLLKHCDQAERTRRLEAYLDKGAGPCFLRNPLIADLVQNALWFRHGIDYDLKAWVIMPNHVHALIQLWGRPLGEILRNWKSFTSKEANYILKRNGSFWAADYFDRYARSEEHEAKFVRYIENNPTKAKLVRRIEDWQWSSARYRSITNYKQLLIPTSLEPGTSCPHQR